MGSIYEARCKKCGHIFHAERGGGMLYHLLQCTRCHRTKRIDFFDIGEAHLKYLKGLGGPYCVASQDHDKYVQGHYPEKAISDKEYRKIIEEMAGRCKCGGKYTFGSRPKCPKCNSAQLEETGMDYICSD